MSVVTVNLFLFVCWLTSHRAGGPIGLSSLCGSETLVPASPGGSSVHVVPLRMCSLRPPTNIVYKSVYILYREVTKACLFLNRIEVAKNASNRIEVGIFL